MEDNSLENNSPLQFLDMDCSRYLYETYYPSETQRAKQKRVMRQLRHHIRGYTLNSFKQVLGGGYCNISRIACQFKAGETGWIWSSISAVGQKVGRGFPIVDNEDGTGYHQFSEETRWVARQFPPLVDQYYDSGGFVEYLREITHQNQHLEISIA